MPAIHDLRCTTCDHRDDDVYLRAKGEDGKWKLPPCTKCGGGTSIRLTAIVTPSTRRRNIPPGLKDEFVNKSGFAWRNSRERMAKHMDDRGKGRIGNQEEFSQYAPLSAEERKDTGIKEPDVTNEVRYLPKDVL
jgi:hypothetical protein